MDPASPVAAEPEHPNVVRYRRMIRAFNEGDFPTIEGFLAPDVVYVVPGKSPVAGRTTGVPGLLGMLRLAKERSGGTLHLDARSVAAAGDHVFVYGRITARREGRALDSDHFVVYRYADGRVVESRTIPVDLYAFDAFWS